MKVAIAQVDRGAESAEGIGFAFRECETAGEIVVGGGVRGLELHQLPVHLQPVGDPAVLGVKAPEDFDDFGVGGVAAQHRLKKADFKRVIVGSCLGHRSRKIYRSVRLAASRARAALAENVAVCADLKALRGGGQAQFR